MRDLGRDARLDEKSWLFRCDLGRVLDRESRRHGIFIFFKEAVSERDERACRGRSDHGREAPPVAEGDSE